MGTHSKILHSCSESPPSGFVTLNMQPGLNLEARYKIRSSLQASNGTEQQSWMKFGSTLGKMNGEKRKQGQNEWRKVRDKGIMKMVGVQWEGAR